MGLAANHGRGHVVRAVLEGVAFSLRDTFTIFSELGVPVERIVVGGGGARSALWREIQASVYGRAVETIAADEGAAYGAAILAGVGAGVWTTVDEAVDATVHRGDHDVARGRGRHRHERTIRAVPAHVSGAAIDCRSHTGCAH